MGFYCIVVKVQQESFVKRPDRVNVDPQKTRLKDKVEQMKYEMANLVERVENLLENLRIQSRDDEETDWL